MKGSSSSMLCSLASVAASMDVNSSVACRSATTPRSTARLPAPAASVLLLVLEYANVCQTAPAMVAAVVCYTYA